MCIIGHVPEIVFRHAQAGHAHLDAEARAESVCRREDGALVGAGVEPECLERRRRSLRCGRRVERERVREDQGAGSAVGDVVADAERVGDGMSCRRVDGAEAEPTIMRGERQAGTSLASLPSATARVR
jgi:hypothetical protein